MAFYLHPIGRKFKFQNIIEIKMARRIKPQQLYWCTTEFHEEDWFMQASSREEAAESHECEEGFNEGDAKAKFICDIPSVFWESEACWPRKETLKILGFEFLQEESPRRVRKDDMIYTEGTHYTSVLLTHEIYKQPLLYLIRARSTTRYKIGYTTNLENRIKQLSAHNPFYLDLVAFFPHPKARAWEYDLKKEFVNYRTNNEWFDFDDDIIGKVLSRIQDYQKLSTEYLSTPKLK